MDASANILEGKDADAFVHGAFVMNEKGSANIEDTRTDKMRRGNNQAVENIKRKTII